MSAFRKLLRMNINFGFKTFNNSTYISSRAEVAAITFSDSAPVPKFLNPDPGPAIFQTCKSDSCSDSSYHTIGPTKIYTCFHLGMTTQKRWLRFRYFHKFLSPAQDPREKHRNPTDSTSATGSMTTSGTGLSQMQLQISLKQYQKLPKSMGVQHKIGVSCKMLKIKLNMICKAN